MPFHIDIIEERIRDLRERKEKIRELLTTAGIRLERKSEQQEEQSFHYKGDSLKDLRVACIMDRLTLDSFSPECVLFELTPSDWMREIEEFKPDLIFVESAWQGKDKLWYRKIDRCSKEIFDLATYCQTKGIPIVFWNKEDPIYTDSFMATARMADFVFTTDIDCIKKYKENLNHNRVYHLHFAAQPNIHNPVEKYDRKDKFCFAGAYYQRYKERCKVFDDFSRVFIKSKGFDIYDRNFQNSQPEHEFPSHYRPYIKGKLDPEEIDIAYKGYYYGVNMNSVSQSQTMFARRAFEMLASNTVTVGNYSRGMKNYFGDLTLCTNDSATLKKLLGKYCSDEETYRKYRLLGLRKVLSEHLYEDRLSYIVEKVFHKRLKSPLPQIYIIGFAYSAEKADLIRRSFSRQSYPHKTLYLISDLNLHPESGDVRVLSCDQAKALDLSKLNGGFVTLFAPDSYYGVNYLTDLALATRYGRFNGVGKADYYSVNGKDISLSGTGYTYKTVPQLSVDRAIIKPEFLPVKTIIEIETLSPIEGEGFFSIDEFNYCGGYTGEFCDRVDDLRIPDQGMSLEGIHEAAGKMQTDDLDRDTTVIQGEELLQLNMTAKSKEITCEAQEGKLMIESAMPDSSHRYLYMSEMLDAALYTDGGKLSLRFNGNGDLDIMGVCVLFDSDKKKLSPVFAQMNRQMAVDIPEKAKYLRLGLRFKGAGKYSFSSIFISSNRQSGDKNCSFVRSNVLVLTNNYPSKETIYRNMFVHKRMTMYKQEGLHFDVFRLNNNPKDNYREFDGIDVIEGEAGVLAGVLEKGNINTVCVHFLDGQMWTVLKNFADSIRIIIWCHGYEIQPWWRRNYNYSTEAELDKAKDESNSRMTLWNEVFARAERSNIHFVFVSKYFARIVMEDYKIQLSSDKFSIIHNCIDSDLFEYIPKSPEQRLKILTIKSFSSKTYANDLTTKAILELSKNEIFQSLEFDVYGDGEEFDTVNAPLRKFRNVHLHKRFLRQEKIAELHKTHGVFIATTRMDTHGVSRDEAMSSGLVVIANNVAAVPEFVDEDCGILVPAEDYMGVAAAIVKLYHEPEYFERLSANAAARVRRQTTKQFTIKREIELITGN